MFRNHRYGVLLMLTLCCSSPASAQSIWAQRADENSLLFYDTRARGVGDLVTVLVSQQTGVDSREDRDLRKSSSLSSLFDLDLESAGKFGTQSASGAFDFAAQSSREFDGRSNYRSAQEVTDQMTATIVAILPNGNFVIEGRRETFVAGESHLLVLSGVIRPIDLSPLNSVHSRFVADLKFSYDPAGSSQAFTRQGWLSRRVNRLWPF